MASSDRVIKCIESYCTHVKGSLGGKPLLLMEWMKQVIRNIYDPVDADGNRLINMVYIEIPRKNSKTTLLAGLALYHLLADGEYGPEVVVAASDRSQATIMQDISKEMVRQNKTLSQMLLVRQYELLSMDRKGFFKAVSSEAGTKHGMNLSFAAFDELHTWKSRELYDVLLTSQVSRKQPLAIAITTAGNDKSGLCWEVREYAQKVKSGDIVDPHFYGEIFCADDRDPWDTEETWKKANPGYGLSVNKAYLERKVLEAKNNPSLIPVFKQLHLNIWNSDYTSWFPRHVYDDNYLKEPDLSRATAYGGLDVASTSDFTSLALVFDMGDGTFYLKNWYWLPSDMLDVRMKRIPAIATWTKKGWIRRTEGNVMDDREISEYIIQQCAKYDVKEIGFDAYNAASLVARLNDAGLPVKKVGQGMAVLSNPSKHVEKLLMGYSIKHDGNPFLGWQLSNCEVYEDVNGNIKITKN